MELFCLQKFNHNISSRSDNSKTIIETKFKFKTRTIQSIYNYYNSNEITTIKSKVTIINLQLSNYKTNVIISDIVKNLVRFVKMCIRKNNLYLILMQLS